MEVSSLFTSAKVAYEIAKGVNSLKNEVERNENIAKILEILLSVQHDALSIQEKYSKLLKEKDEIAKKLMDLDRWSDIENNYELKEVSAGIFVYSYKKHANSSTPSHWLCTNCYKDKKFSIIQVGIKYPASKDYICPSCTNKFNIHN
jgi:hypothetical protein